MSATSTYMTFLMHKKEDTYEKLIDITEFPDLGTDPEMLETTTLSDRMQTFILGIQGNEGLNFNTNYDHDGYLALKALERNRMTALSLLLVPRASSPLTVSFLSVSRVAA